MFDQHRQSVIGFAWTVVFTSGFEGFIDRWWNEKLELEKSGAAGGDGPPDLFGARHAAAGAADLAFGGFFGWSRVGWIRHELGNCRGRGDNPL